MVLIKISINHFFFDFIECFTTTFLRAHSWLNWVDEDDDEHDEVGLKVINHRNVFVFFTITKYLIFFVSI